MANSEIPMEYSLYEWTLELQAKPEVDQFKGVLKKKKKKRAMFSGALLILAT
jgi:hypothetical protein